MKFSLVCAVQTEQKGSGECLSEHILEEFCHYLHEVEYADQHLKLLSLEAHLPAGIEILVLQGPSYLNSA